MLFKLPNFTICPLASFNEGGWYYCIGSLKSCNQLCLINDYYKMCPRIELKELIE